MTSKLAASLTQTSLLIRINLKVVKMEMEDLGATPREANASKEHHPTLLHETSVSTSMPIATPR
jgi:hypothetical protein